MVKTGVFEIGSEGLPKLKKHEKRDFRCCSGRELLTLAAIDAKLSVQIKRWKRPKGRVINDYQRCLEQN